MSTLIQAQYGFSLAAQVKDCFQLAEELGAAVVGNYEDNDSGAEWDLPQLNAMLAAAKRREFDVLLVYDPDRLARNMAKQLVIEEELKRYGVTIRYVSLRLGDSAEDRLLKNVRASIAEYEREKIKMRTQRGLREKAERGQVVGGGPPPYGYRYVRDERQIPYTLELDSVTAPILQRIFRMLPSLSSVDLARQLDAERIPAPNGSGWHPGTIRRIVTSTVYLGLWIYGRRGRQIGPEDSADVIRVPVPQLVDRPTWDAAQRALMRRRSARRGRAPRKADPFVLRGLLTCCHCGGTLATVRNKGFRYYGCLRHTPPLAGLLHRERCRLPDVLAEPLEAYIWRLVTDTLLDPESLRTGLPAARAQHDRADVQRQARLAILDAEIAVHRARLEKIVRQRLDADPGGELEALYLRNAQETERTIAGLQAERARLAVLRTDGLSAEEALTLETFAAEVRAGITGAAPADQRHVYELLRLTGRVRQDPGGVRLGQRHAFTLEWEAQIQLPVSGAGSCGSPPG